MVNNSTSINKTNNHLSSYWEHKKRPWHMTLEIQFQVWDRHKNVAVLIWLMESQCMDATGFYKSKHRLVFVLPKWKIYIS